MKEIKVEEKYFKLSNGKYKLQWETANPTNSMVIFESSVVDGEIVKINGLEYYVHYPFTENLLSIWYEII